MLMSEIYYLSYMNKWHRMHKYFNNLSSLSDKIKLALDGIDDKYPPASNRFMNYYGWLASKSCLAVRFEDLVSKNRFETYDLIFNYLSKEINVQLMPHEIRAKLDKLQPEKSHTYRKKSEKHWNDNLSVSDVNLVNTTLDPVLRAYGYAV